jgi:arabinogalactan oligomer/maltooligosaccharide transport system permease protein
MPAAAQATSAAPSPQRRSSLIRTSGPGHIGFVRKASSLAILLLFCVISVYPVAHVLSVSLRPGNAFHSQSLMLIEPGSNFNSYVKLFTQTPFLTWLKNSVLVSAVTTLSGVALAATSGYALSRFQFAGKKWLLVSLMTTQMFPATMLLLPFFIVISKLGLMNSFIGLFIIYSSTALPFCIWQLKGYYDTIPKELEEAARLDGCTSWMAFYRVILPLSTPALVITALFSFMSSWSEYMVAAVILQDPELYTLPLGLKSFQASLATEWGLYAAGAVIVSLPVIVLFISLARYLVSGLTLGSVKG